MNHSRTLAAGTTLLAALSAAPAQASIFGSPQQDYFALGAAAFVPDSGRDASTGVGGSVGYGLYLGERTALEGRAFGATFDSDSNAIGALSQFGAGVDLVFRPSAGSHWFLLGGAGGAETGPDDRASVSPYVDLGAGWRSTAAALRYRFEARGVNHLANDGRTDIWAGLTFEYLPPVAALATGARSGSALVAGVADADEDGVADTADQCPAQRAPKVGPDGCVWEEQVVTLSNLNFASESEALTAEIRGRLDEVVGRYGSQQVLKIEVHGHADATDSEARNLDLSRRRAASVLAYLASRGVREETLTSEGFGETRPIATNETPEGRGVNRRVELHIHTRQPQS